MKSLTEIKLDNFPPLSRELLKLPCVHISDNQPYLAIVTWTHRQTIDLELFNYDGIALEAFKGVTKDLLAQAKVAVAEKLLLLDYLEKQYK